MADGLLQMLGSGQQAQQEQQQGNLLGGLFQSESQARRQGRERLLGQALQIAQQQDPIRSGFAVAGGLLGEGIGRAMGRVTPEEARQQKFAGLQTQLMQEGLDPTKDPFAFYRGAGEMLAEMGEQGAALQAFNMSEKYRQDPVETKIRFVGGTPRAEALQKRYPQVGKVEDGQEITLTLSNGEFRGVEAGKVPKEDKPEQPELSNVRDIQTENGTVTVGTFNNKLVEVTSEGLKPFSGERLQETNTPPIPSSLSSADRELFESALSINPDLKEKFDKTVEKPKFFGLVDGDEKERKTVLFDRAYNIRRADSSLTAEQALEIAVNEITANFENTDTPDAQPGAATPENDPFAGALNP